jgi:DNA repair protein RadC
MAHNKPHYFDHRKRIKERYLKGGLSAFHDYEILELILTFAILRKDVKPVAKELIARFKNIQGVLDARVDELTAVPGIGNHAALLIKLIRDCTDLYLRQKITRTVCISSPADLLQYCKAAMAHCANEQFRVVYLNAKNIVIGDEVIQQGTVDQTAVYPRSVVEHALRHHATGLIFVHNHPSGDPRPSQQDRDLTRTLLQAVAPFGMTVHDHIIIGKNGYYSFKEKGDL